MSDSTSTPLPQDSSPSEPFSFKEFNDLIAGTEMLYALGKRLSIGVQNKPCEYLILEASTRSQK
jgi:hypothetical protein